MEYFYFYLFVAFSMFYSCYCIDFFYFAYGSNLSGKRLKINSPSARLFDVAVLKGYRLDFGMYNKMWNGAVATIVEDPEESVTGALWLLDIKDMPNLDKQEGVDKGWYIPKLVVVRMLDGRTRPARTYQLTVNPPKNRTSEVLPNERRPSNTYLEVLVFGAAESGLPSDYIGDLISIQTNGEQASDEIRKELGYPFGPKNETH